LQRDVFVRVVAVKFLQFWLTRNVSYYRKIVGNVITTGTLRHTASCPISRKPSIWVQITALRPGMSERRVKQPKRAVRLFGKQGAQPIEVSQQLYSIRYFPAKS
jgi:hypothetical protein